MVKTNKTFKLDEKTQQIIVALANEMKTSQSEVIAAVIAKAFARADPDRDELVKVYDFIKDILLRLGEVEQKKGLTSDQSKLVRFLTNVREQCRSMPQFPVAWDRGGSYRKIG